jgi:hypothetical protein
LARTGERRQEAEAPCRSGALIAPPSSPFFSFFDWPTPSLLSSRYLLWSCADIGEVHGLNETLLVHSGLLLSAFTFF